MPQASASQAEPVTAATDAAAKAAASIFPSSPISTMPERSDSSPAMAQRISGVESRSAAAKVRRRSSGSTSCLLEGGAPAREQGEQRLEPGAAEMRERAGEEYHQPLDDCHHVAVDVGHLEGELGTSLGQDAEQDRGEHDAQRVVAAHQRDRNAGEAIAGIEVQQQAMLHAHHLVDADEAGKRARDAERDQDHPSRLDAGIDCSPLALAHGAQLVAPGRMPDIDPDEDA